MPVQSIELFVEQASHDPPMPHRPGGNCEEHRQRRIQPEARRKTQPHLEYPQDKQESQPSTCTKLASPQRGQKCAGAPSLGMLKGDLVAGAGGRMPMKPISTIWR